MAVAWLLVACGGPGAAPPTAAPVDARPTGPLTDLPTCGAPPADPGLPPVPGLRVPPGAVVTTVQPMDPVVNVIGWAPLTPSQMRRTYEALPGVELLTVEDESYDAEVLLTDGTWRMYVKMTAACDAASDFAAVVIDEAAATGGGAQVPQSSSAAVSGT